MDRWFCTVKRSDGRLTTLTVTAVGAEEAKAEARRLVADSEKTRTRATLLEEAPRLC